MQLLPKKIIPTWEVKNTKFEISPLGGYGTHLEALTESVRERFTQLLPKKIIPTCKDKNTKFDISPLGGYGRSRIFVCRKAVRRTFLRG